MPHKPLPHTKQTATSADLEWGTDSLSRIYKAATPGQEDAVGEAFGVTKSFLAELGDRPYPWSMKVYRDRRFGADAYRAQFSIPGTKLFYWATMWATKMSGSIDHDGLPDFLPSEPIEYEFGFSRGNNDRLPGNTDIIGNTGIEIPVFATVVDIFKAMVKQAKPLKVVYTAKGVSRQRLYSRLTRMIQRVIPGYKGFEVKSGSYEVRSNRYVPEEHTMSIPSFREYLQEAAAAVNVDGKPGSAVAFESYICDAWNALLDDKTARKFSRGMARVHHTYAPTAFLIARTLQKSIRTNSRLEKAAHAPRVSAKYAEYGGTNKTSKTDIYAVSDHTYRFSLKEHAGSALMSGLRGDTMATFQLAVDRSKKLPSSSVGKLTDALQRSLENIERPKGIEKHIDMKHMTTKPGVKPPGIMTAAKDANYRRGLPRPIKAFLKKILLRDEGIKGEMNAAITEAFNADQIFREEFVYEAASGYGKFGGGKAVPIANHFLKFSKATGAAAVSKFASARAPVIGSLAEQVRFRLRWKHSAIALAVDIRDSREHTYQDLLAEHWEAAMLNEGMWDSIKDTWRDFTAFLRRFVSAVVGALRKAAAKGYQAVLRFLGLELEYVALEHDVFV